MPATLAKLIEVRSQLVEEVLAYLNTLADDATQVPSYYPEHLKTIEAGEERFDAIRQAVQVVDRKAFEDWRTRDLEAQQHEQHFRSGYGDRRRYEPRRAYSKSDEDVERDRPADRRRENRPPPPPVIWDEKAGERFKRAVILGDPGFGKTWLLRFEARRLARVAAQGLKDHTLGLDALLFPILLRLSAFNDADVLKQRKLLETKLIELLGARRSEGFGRYVAAKLKTSHCVLLFDALDEVPSGVRATLKERLSEFSQAFPYPRILISSRIVGYAGSPFAVNQNAQELELLAFDTQHIDRFARVWFANTAQGAKTAGRFLTALRQHPQVSGLAQIPLILALMCRAFQDPKLSFPTRRVELYDRCLKGLLHDWKAKSGPGDPMDAEVYVKAVLALLEPAAYTLFFKGQEEFTTVEFEEAIAPHFERLAPEHTLRRRHSLGGLIAELKQDGILVQTGAGNEPRFIFLHLTFQEYLAAGHLARSAEPETTVYDPMTLTYVTKIRPDWSAVASLVDAKAWHPSWQEVLVLFAGKLHDPGPYLDLFTDEKADVARDDYFRHRLALATLALAEMAVDVRKQHRNRVDDITAVAFRFWWDYASKGIEAAIAHLTRTLAAVGQVNRDISIAGTRLIASALGDESDYVRSVAAQALGALGTAVATPEVMERLTAALEDEHAYVRSVAAQALGALGATAATPEVLERLTNEQGYRPGCFYGRGWAISHYGWLVRNPRLLALTISIWDKMTGYYERLCFIRALGGLRALGVAVTTPEVMERLTAALGDGEIELRHGAAEALGSFHSQGYRFFKHRGGGWEIKHVEELSQL